MSIQPAWQQHLDSFGNRPIVLEPSQARLSSDGGLLPIRQFDERLGLTAAFAQALDDPRDPDRSEHTFLEMVRARVYGILAGYEDQNNHDTLRADPVFKLLADPSPDDNDLASQPAHSVPLRERYQHQIPQAAARRLSRPVHRLLRCAAPPPDVRPRCRR